MKAATLATDAPPLPPNVGLPALRSFRVRTATANVIIDAHSVSQSDGVLMFSLYKMMQVEGGVAPIEHIIRAFASWQDMEELIIPVGSGAVQ